MKKLLVCLLVVMFAIACNIDHEAEREIEGTVVAATDLTFKEIEGKLVIWNKEIRPTTGGRQGEIGEGAEYNIWFVYPAEKFTIEPGHKVRLKYELVKMGDRFPIVHVLEAEDLGLL